jgi:hypothetical protein
VSRNAADADWLEKLGMSEYAQRSAENGIDVSALPHLTDQDLKDLGVLLGHRRKMLAAIGQLSGETAAAAEPATRIEQKPQDTAERRQVTVLFSAGARGIPKTVYFKSGREAFDRHCKYGNIDALRNGCIRLGLIVPGALTADSDGY